MTIRKSAVNLNLVLTTVKSVVGFFHNTLGARSSVILRIVSIKLHFHLVYFATQNVQTELRSTFQRMALTWEVNSD